MVIVNMAVMNIGVHISFKTMLFTRCMSRHGIDGSYGSSMLGFFSSVQFSPSVVSNYLWPHGLQHARLPCPLLTAGASSNSVMPSNHVILSRSLLLLPSIFPSIRVFSSESALHIRWPNIGASASASVLPINIQDWLPLGLTVLISLQYQGLSRYFCNTTVQKHLLFGTQAFYGQTFTFIHDYSKKRSFDYTELCHQSDVSAF